MHLLIALLLIFIPVPLPLPCQMLHAPAGSVSIRASTEQMAGIIYTTQSVLATDGVVTDTVTLMHGFVVTSPPIPIRVTAAYPYAFYVCQTGVRPGVMYLPHV